MDLGRWEIAVGHSPSVPLPLCAYPPSLPPCTPNLLNKIQIADCSCHQVGREDWKARDGSRRDSNGRKGSWKKDLSGTEPAEMPLATFQRL